MQISYALGKNCITFLKTDFMQNDQSTPEMIIQHHLNALGQNDLAELMVDYTEESEVWTQEGILSGKEAISNFFSYAFTLLPKNKTSLDIKKMITKDEKVYMVWSASSPVIDVSFATDCFQIIDGKILWQSIAFEGTPK